MNRNELMMLQALPLEIKILKSQQRIREWYGHWAGDVYVSFSGGLDSTVLLDLVRKLYPDVPAVYVDTGLEFPEVRNHALSFSPVVLRPKISFYEVLQRYGYPVVSKEQAQYIHEARTTNSAKLRDVRLNGRPGKKPGVKFGYIKNKWKYLLDAPFKISDRCCHVMKKEPIHRYEKETGRKAYVGLKASDSHTRYSTVLQRGGCNAYIGKQQSWPMSFWTDQDVLRYIVNEKLQYPSVYGDIIDTGLFEAELSTTGEDRTGCMFCMFGCHLDKPVNRFQRMKKTHPKLHEYCMTTLGLGDVLDYMGVAKE